MKRKNAFAAVSCMMLMLSIGLGGCGSGQSGDAAVSDNSAAEEENISEPSLSEEPVSTDSEETIEESAAASVVKGISYYNQNDELIRTEEYDEAGQLVRLNDYENRKYTLYTYENGKETAREKYEDGADSPYDTYGSYEYNDLGQVTYILSNRTDDAEVTYYRYEYDTSGSLIREESNHYSYVYEYDSYGNMTRCENYEYDQLTTVMEYTYQLDENGNPLAAYAVRSLVDGYEGSDEPVYDYSYIYEEGRLISVTTTYSQTGKQSARSEYTYYE